MSVEKIVVYSLTCDECSRRINQYTANIGNVQPELPKGWVAHYDAANYVTTHKCNWCAGLDDPR